jgi:hypothetical protein
MKGSQTISSKLFDLFDSIALPSVDAYAKEHQHQQLVVSIDVIPE